ncbi:MAG TPA: hypothetical protein VFN35_07740 [Ktedonobacteraceae bacterium]|nr:hypothetical protein [Ktedonobacteraceae bacterium]
MPSSSTRRSQAVNQFVLRAESGIITWAAKQVVKNINCYGNQAAAISDFWW